MNMFLQDRLPELEYKRHCPSVVSSHLVIQRREEYEGFEREEGRRRRVGDQHVGKRRALARWYAVHGFSDLVAQH